MTDETGDRPEEPAGAAAARPPRARASPSRRRSAERFTAPRQTRAIGGLTSERAAKIVRQSGDARWVAFLGVVIVALFVIVYYFYELGRPDHQHHAAARGAGRTPAGHRPSSAATTCTRRTARAATASTARAASGRS